MSDYMPWYDGLVKPSWTPASATIGAIWTVVYPLIAVAVVGTVLRVSRGELSRVVLVPLVLNLVANIAYLERQGGRATNRG